MSVYEEIMDSLLWVADQQGCGEEARKIYSDIKKEKKANESKGRGMIDVLGKFDESSDMTKGYGRIARKVARDLDHYYNIPVEKTYRFFDKNNVAFKESEPVDIEELAFIIDNFLEDDDIDESLSLEDLSSKANDLYNRRYPDSWKSGTVDPRTKAFADAFSPKELAELWASCMFSKENPYGQAYDDEVYDAIQYYGSKYEWLADNIFITANEIYNKKYHPINDDDIKESAEDELHNKALKLVKKKNEAMADDIILYDDDEKSWDKDRYEKISHKTVYDSDGFTTDYTLYYDKEEDNYFTIFGDDEIYGPDDYHDADFEGNKEAAMEWMETYGEEDDDIDFSDIDFDESLNEEETPVGHYSDKFLDAHQGEWVSDDMFVPKLDPVTGEIIFPKEMLDDWE